VAGALTPVLTVVVAATMTRVVAVAGLSSLLLPPTPAGIQCHMLRGGGRVGRAWGGDGLFVVACWLVGGCGLAMVPGRAFPIVRRLEDKHVVTVSR
jgi:hypothetical protein